MLIGRMLTTRNAARSRKAIRLLRGKRGSASTVSDASIGRSFTWFRVALLVGVTGAAPETPADGEPRVEFGERVALLSSLRQTGSGRSHRFRES